MSLDPSRTYLEALESRRTASIARQMFFCLAIFRDRVLAKLTRLGYSSVRWSDGTVFRNIDLAGTSLSEVARRAKVSRQAIAKLANEQVAKGYLEISPDPNDRRAKIVRFTDEGLKLAEVITAVNEEVESELAHVIGRKSIDTLGATLACIIDSELPPP